MAASIISEKQVAKPRDDISEVEKSIKEEPVEEQQEYITPPDGGRGWLVVFAASMVCLFFYPEKNFIPKKKKTDI